MSLPILRGNGVSALCNAGAAFLRRSRGTLLRAGPRPTLFHEGHEILILERLQGFPHGVWNGQREKVAHIFLHSFRGDEQALLPRFLIGTEVENDETDKQFFVLSDRVLGQVGLWFTNARQLRLVIKLGPDFPVVLGEIPQVGHALDFAVRAERPRP